MAREQPQLHFLYRSIDAIAGAKFDKEGLRARMIALQTRPPDDLAQLNVPTLFITGDEDVVFPPMLAPALAALMPNARVEEVETAGHEHDAKPAGSETATSCAITTGELSTPSSFWWA